MYQLKKKRENRKLFKEGYCPAYSSISLRYGLERNVYLRIGTTNTEKIKQLAKDYFDENNFLKKSCYDTFDKFLEQAISIDSDFRCYQDAIEYIMAVRSHKHRKEIIKKKYSEEKALDTLLNTTLFPYQKEGILFATIAGRSMIADEMGLGKTIQAIGVSELMAKEFGVEKVLIICPTSLKYQWKTEIKKFCGKDALVIEGMVHKRKAQYNSDCLFKIISYNVIKSDISHINAMAPDFIILDEAQRIKNWKTQTAQYVKSLNSEYALVLTGTPLENRLEELHSIVQFIDIFRLGPLFRFLNNHQQADDNGKVIGYTNLHD